MLKTLVKSLLKTLLKIFFMVYIFTIYKLKRAKYFSAVFKVMEHYWVDLNLEHFCNETKKQFSSGKVYEYTSLVKKDENGKINIDHTINDRILDTYLDDQVSKYTALKDGESFLEIGCGAGQNLIHIHSRFPSSKVAGVDISPLGIENAKSMMPNGDFAVADLHDLESVKRLLEGKKFDHIFVSHVMEHIFKESVEKTFNYRKELLEILMSKTNKTLTFIGSVIVGAKDADVNLIHLGYGRIALQCNVAPCLDEDQNIEKSFFTSKDGNFTIIYKKSNLF